MIKSEHKHNAIRWMVQTIWAITRESSIILRLKINIWQLGLKWRIGQKIRVSQTKQQRKKKLCQLWVFVSVASLYPATDRKMSDSTAHRSAKQVWGYFFYFCFVSGSSLRSLCVFIQHVTSSSHFPSESFRLKLWASPAHRDMYSVSSWRKKKWFFFTPPQTNKKYTHTIPRYHPISGMKAHGGKPSKASSSFNDIWMIKQHNTNNNKNECGDGDNSNITTKYVTMD